MAENTGNEKQGQQSQKQPISIFVRNSFPKPNSKAFWIILLLWAMIIIGVLWWFGNLKFLLYTIYAVIVIRFLYLIFKGFAVSSKENDQASFFVALALVVWAIDLIPSSISMFGITLPLSFLGPPYAGFEFDLAGVLNTNWAAVITSGIIIAFLLIGFFFDLSRGKFLPVVLTLILLHFLNKFLVFYFTNTLHYAYVNNIILIGIIAGIILLFLFKDKLKGTDFADWPTYIFMALVFSFFWVNIGWSNNTRAVIHVIYILWFGFGFVKSMEKDQPANWHLLVPVLLIVDFYGYGLLLKYFTGFFDFFRFIPVLVLAVILYCNNKSKTDYPNRVLVFIIILVLVSVVPSQAIETGSINFKAQEGADYKDFFKQFGDQIREMIEGRLDVATAGLYTGNVEKNQYESLGVYFGSIRAADPRFYTDEPITVWGTIRSKTYKDAVIVNFSCYRWNGDKKIPADKVIPNIPFPVFTFEEIDTQCTFLPSRFSASGDNALTSGPNTVTFDAQYNFGTDSYLKTYFIDRDRFKANARENIDPLTQFGIKDKNPVTVYTNGPVEIGLNAGPLVTVSEGYEVNPTIGITLTNRQEIYDKDKNIITRWEGNIKNITELILLVPPGIELPKIEQCKAPKNTLERLDCPCSMPFKKYSSTECRATCTDTVKKPCEEACKLGYPGNDDNSKKQQKKCIDDCQTANANCESECDFLFSPAGEQNLQGDYQGYALDVGSLEFKDLNKDIDKHRSFVCRFNPSTKVLDNTPITTRYFRVRARYNYQLQNSVQINVEKSLISSITSQESFFKTATEFKPDADIFNPQGINPDLVTAIAYVESGLKHCCQAGYGGAGKICYASGDELCPTDRIHTSGTSIGIMQVRYDTSKIKAEVDKKVNDLCPPGHKSIYDFQCNIMVGMSILSDKYRSYKNGCLNSQEYKTYPNIKNACDTCASSAAYGSVPYKSYLGGDAAVRAYNGWGCSSNYDRDYVEKVKKALQGIKDGRIVDDRIQSLFGSRAGEGMVDDTQSSTTAKS